MNKTNGLRPSAVVFDMDGVLNDSLPSLYQAYLEFLSEYGVEGTPEEFAVLNGPKISEIVQYLNQKHQLADDELYLEWQYKRQVEQHLKQPTPIPGMCELVFRLYSEGVPLVVASSSPRSLIQRVLGTFEIDECFRRTLSGDDVPNAKPAPDIYREAAKLFPDHRLVVVEDSQHGVSAALAAGLEVIHFSEYDEPDERATWVCESVNQVGEVLSRQLFPAETVGLAEEFRLESSSNSNLLSHQQEERVGEIWKAKSLENPFLFDGPVVRYVSHEAEGNCIAVRVVESSYRYVIAEWDEPDLADGNSGLGVSGMVVDSNGRVLVGCRGEVSQFGNWWELAPSGGVEPMEDSGLPDPEKQILIELQEEAGIAGEQVIEIRPLGLIHDQWHGLFDLGFLIRVPAETDVTANGEYSELMWLKPDELDATLGKLIPTSVQLIEAYRGKS